jgi:hypothetical protein
MAKGNLPTEGHDVPGLCQGDVKEDQDDDMQKKGGTVKNREEKEAKEEKD